MNEFLDRKAPKIRRAVIRRHPDHCVISADFNGQELRIMTSESRDPVLLDAYLGEVKKDIHTITATAIGPTLLARQDTALHNWLAPRGPAGAYGYDDVHALRKLKAASLSGIPQEWTTEEEVKRLGDLIDGVRSDAKPVNFTIAYLGTEIALARKMLISRELAREFLEKTMARYARLSPWQEEVIEFARRHGYTRTAYGSRRHVSNDIYARDGGLRSRMERQAVNFVIQGCAADILKRVLSGMKRTGLIRDTGAQLYAPIYDEILASVPKARALEYCQRLAELMNVTPPGHDVPMVAEFGIGYYSWGDQFELGDNVTQERIDLALEKTRYEPAAA